MMDTTTTNYTNYTVSTGTSEKTNLDSFYNAIFTISDLLSNEPIIKTDILPNTIYYNNNLNNPINPKIIKVEILCPQKVIRFTFSDGKIIKTICDDYDVFDFEFAFYIAWVKHDFYGIYTPEGIFHKAKELTYLKEYNKKVKDGIKVFKKAEKEKEEKKFKEEKDKEIANNKRKKQAYNKKKKKAIAREERINELAEAIKKVNEI